VIATDQAFKEAVETYSRSKAYLSSLARQSDIDDFAKAEPVQLIEPLETADWTSRNWDQKRARRRQRCGRFRDSRIARDLLLVYATEYLLTRRKQKSPESSFCSDRSRNERPGRRWLPLNHFYAAYTARPASCPALRRCARD